MKFMTTAEIREAYLKFFEEKGCKRMPSSSLIPDDPSLLLTSAGMVQFKPYFLQQKQLDSKYIGATTAQKCVRTNDIDIIGTTGRHLSFFEMMGNFSFGKYFKREMCAWALEFSCDVLGLPLEKLYFTVYKDDDETIEIWKSLGVDPTHISRLGEEDNFWRAGPTGPCGPCSELYYDTGKECSLHNPNCAPGCDCDRFLEYWNCVFTQFDGQEDGSLPPLPHKNIDTGMGLERIACILQGVDSNYETDVLRSLVGVGERLSGKKYGEDKSSDLCLRIVADHSRAVTFMIADGILPGNDGRGYVLRHLLRRAIMKASLIGIEGPFLNEYVDEIVRLMGSVYPEIVENRELERKLILAEEERFGATVDAGRDYLKKTLKSIDGNVLPGDVAFKLHDTYGFPVDLTAEICAEHNIDVDMKRFEECMREQKERARAAGSKDAEAAWSTYGGVYSDILGECGPTKFVGYNTFEDECKVLAIIKDGKSVLSATKGDKCEVVLDKTPFYAEKGGEVGDTGWFESKTTRLNAVVDDTKTPESGLHVHIIHIVEGQIALGDVLIAKIDVSRRKLIQRNHTATHILHASLKRVLGDHVKQAGSFVDNNRLRFDFTHFEAMTAEQISQVENIANEYIMAAHDLNTYEESLDEARAAGVTALFGEKYGDVVRVVDAGEFSRELCAGCHVNNTAEIGFVKIVSESGVGANLRRIEAVTSAGALSYVNKIEAELKESATILKVPLFNVSERSAKDVKVIKDMRQGIGKAKDMVSQDKLKALLDGAVVAKGGFKLIAAVLDECWQADGLKQVCDVLRGRTKEPVACVLGCVTEDKKPILVAAADDKAIERGFSAVDVIKQIGSCIQGGGGGKPGMAQAGGKDASGLQAAVDKAIELL